MDKLKHDLTSKCGEEHLKLLSEWLFQLVHLTDFIGCEQFLVMVASRLRVTVLAINNANPIRAARGLI